MNNVNVSGVVMDISNINTVDGKLQCLIELSLENSSDTLYVSCESQLAKNVTSQILVSYDVVVLGKLGYVFALNDNGEKKNLGLGVIASAVVVDNKVYPTDYSQQSAIAEKEKAEYQEKIAKALENYDDDDTMF